MTKTALIRFLVLFLIVQSAYGQKVKYKDIFALLNSKQYEQAEPFLKRYLKENDDNPNAYLFMGIIFQEKSVKTDVLKQTSLAIANMDSAIYFYSKAYPMIDDKEVRRNKEYYQLYNRRDLRTGEFGVKLSDIQFDIDKKKEALKEKIDKVKMLKHFFSLADSLYRQSNRLYRSLAASFPTEQKIFLQGDENTLRTLSQLSAKFDSCAKAFDSYKTVSSNIGKTGYSQIWTVTEIRNFPKDGIEITDFYRDDLPVWDYKQFADRVKSTIEKEVVPMREHLITYDIEINKLRDKLTTDSVSVRNDLMKLIDKLLYDQLKKFDAEPLPMEIFSLKTSDLEYRSALLENRQLRDSADVHIRLRALTSELKLANKLDSIATRISAQDIDEEARDYPHFVANTYSNTVVLKSYVKTLKDYAEREKHQKAQAIAENTKAMDWIVDGSDSIPLSSQMANRYKPLYTAPEKFTLGLHVNDSVNSDGYFYTITPSRKPDVKVVFPVDKSSFKEKKVSSTRGLSFADAAGQIFFVLIFSDQPLKDKYSATLAKIYRSDGLAWSNNYQVGFVPKEITFRQDNGELTIKNETQQTVIDKNGKVLR